jgi:hypothetical protein
LFVAEGARVVIGDVLEPEGHQLGSELGNEHAVCAPGIHRSPPISRSIAASWRC